MNYITVLELMSHELHHSLELMSQELIHHSLELMSQELIHQSLELMFTTTASFVHLCDLI